MKIRITQILIVGMSMTFGFLPSQAQQRAVRKKQREVKIYLLKPGVAYNAKNPAHLFAVRRTVDAAAPLQATLKALTRGASKREEKRKLLDSTYGIRFVSVTLENGTARAHFTMPEDATFTGTNSPLIFIEAVKQTALQFRAVKEVVVCLDGETDFWREDDSGESQSC